MIIWTKTEKRRSPRFEIDIPFSASLCSDSCDFQAKTRDISAWGAGVLVKEHLPIGVSIILEISSPENEDIYSLKGRVIWVKSLDIPGYFRTGISFSSDNFNPIPLVLKMLQLKAAARTRSSRINPA